MCSGFLPLGFFVRATAEPGHFWDEIGSWFLLHSLVLPATTSGSPSLFGCIEWRCLGWKIFCYSWSCFSCSDRISESEITRGGIYLGIFFLFFWVFFSFFGPLVPWSSNPLVPWSSRPPSSRPLIVWSPVPVPWSSGPLLLWSSGFLVLCSFSFLFF